MPIICPKDEIDDTEFLKVGGETNEGDADGDGDDDMIDECLTWWNMVLTMRLEVTAALVWVMVAEIVVVVMVVIVMKILTANVDEKNNKKMQGPQWWFEPRVKSAISVPSKEPPTL